jgi:prevent-host-death family protein
MDKVWQLQEAKKRFSEVVDLALREGPQEISRHGKKAVVIVSCEEFNRMKRGSESLEEFLRKSPLRGLELDRSRR